MYGMHSSLVDPSLWRALDALLQERHVSRAAARVGLTQSAMSRVLARLRVDLRDPLLVRAGRSMVLTPRAEALAPRLHAALTGVDHVLGERQAFDPATSRRTFRVTTADYGVAVVIVPLMARVSRQAPLVSVAVEPFRADFEEELSAGTLDMAIVPRRHSGGSLVWTKLRSEPFLTLVRKGNPRVGRRLDLDTFCALSHVVVAPERRTGNALDTMLASLGRTRHVALRVPSFVAAPLAVADSDMVLTAPESIARRFASVLGLRVFEPPLPTEALSLAFGWHERQRNDPGHRWLRKLIAGREP
jgi:DNA-binding transcriptional LysR family regulator